MRMRILSSSSKPISSPGRTDKFPPPLMRFLKSNVSSRSTRGRSSSTRTNSLFFGKMKSSSRRNRTTPGSGLEPTQEPSSPKVTCIGQVRVRRSKKSNYNKSKSNAQQKRPSNNKCTTGCYNPCCCFRKPGFLKRVRPGWPKWRWVFWSGCCRSVKVRTAASSKNGGSSRFEEPIQPERVTEDSRRSFVDEDNNGYVRGRRSSAAALSLSLSLDDDDDDDNDVFVKGRRSSAASTTTTTTTPPKNALLLTRCRSAPYRSSSLACRFWCEEEDTEDNNNEEEEDNMMGVVLGGVRKSNSSRDSTASEPRGDRDSNFSDDNEESKSIGVCAAAAEEHAVKNDVNEEGKSKSKRDDEDEDEEDKNGKEEGENDKDGSLVLGGGTTTTTVGLMLIRCKSEPARRGMEKYDPQGSEFWRLRRLGNTLNSSPHVAD